MERDRSLPYSHYKHHKQSHASYNSKINLEEYQRALRSPISSQGFQEYYKLMPGEQSQEYDFSQQFPIGYSGQIHKDESKSEENEIPSWRRSRMHAASVPFVSDLENSYVQGGRKQREQLSEGRWQIPVSKLSTYNYTAQSSQPIIPTAFLSYPPVHGHMTSEPSNNFSIPSLPSTPYAQESLPREPQKRIKGIDGEENESDLKKEALKYVNTSLADVAQQIKFVEKEETTERDSIETSKRDSKGERQKVVFGMAWLLKSCELSSVSVVPRHKIYSIYSRVCEDYDLQPLSPASFGKIVRSLFPNLTTRRLGMRGRSKYHYCGLKLVEDYYPGRSNKSVSPSMPSATVEPRSAIGEHGISSNRELLIGTEKSLNLTAALDIVSEVEGVRTLKMKRIPNILRFLCDSLTLEDTNPSLELPEMDAYIMSPFTENGLAETLLSLYKTYCSSIFESLRYMETTKLFGSFHNFMNILSTPMLELYTSNGMAAWVHKCDKFTYKMMIKMLTKLTLQAVPEEIVKKLKLIANGFSKSLAESLEGKAPEGFFLMKIKQSNTFTELIKRLVKVIETGLPARQLFECRPEKEIMLSDWKKIGIEEIVLREVPCGYENIKILLEILRMDVYYLLNDAVFGSQPIFFDDIAYVLSEIPSKFPNVEPRLFTLVSSNLLTSFLREISLKHGEGFGTWWIIRCWLDEFFRWCFELGGYFEEDFIS